MEREGIWRYRVRHGGLELIIDFSDSKVFARPPTTVDRQIKQRHHRNNYVDQLQLNLVGNQKLRECKAGAGSDMRLHGQKADAHQHKDHWNCRQITACLANLSSRLSVAPPRGAKLALKPADELIDFGRHQPRRRVYRVNFLRGK